MFDRLEKPFLTVETGEAYQPVRLTYAVHDFSAFTDKLSSVQCVRPNAVSGSWSWFWDKECADLPFQSLRSFQKSFLHPLRLGSFSIKDQTCFLHLTSFKRACLAVPFFHKLFPSSAVTLTYADFVNKVFSTDERLPHEFSELFNETDLHQVLEKRIQDYEAIKHQCESASSPEEAIALFSQYANQEMHKKLPYAERYAFHLSDEQDPEVIFLAFYIYLRGRELVAIRRWVTQMGCDDADSIEADLSSVFGDMGIDLLE